MGYFYSSKDDVPAQGGTPHSGGGTLRGEWANFVEGFAPWKVFATFTFENPDVSKDVAHYTFRRWWQIMNADLYGKRYVNYVGHGYCAYALAYEKQSRGTWHMHGLFADRINFQLAHTVWERLAGFLWLEAAKEAHPIYLCKYISKGGEVTLFRPDKHKEPAFKPDWYTGSASYPVRIPKVANGSKQESSPAPSLSESESYADRQMSLPLREFSG